jgi:hypothetical protein
MIEFQNGDGTGPTRQLPAVAAESREASEFTELTALL